MMHAVTKVHCLTAVFQFESVSSVDPEGWQMYVWTLCIGGCPFCAPDLIHCFVHWPHRHWLSNNSTDTYLPYSRWTWVSQFSLGFSSSPYCRI